jgi:hypothetical protein
VKINLGERVSIDLKRLIKSRLLLQANSGGGKSWTLRRLLEQTHGHIQQIVIDPEDEFYTLREKFDYILVRHDGGDCVPDVRSAELLAIRLLELGVSAIISLYELHPRERREFVRRFLDSLVNAKKTLWHRALIVVDEAHEFCPEQGKQKKGDAVADSVIGLMAKGRKRGFCGVLATQRISKLNKDAAAEANNKLIGRATIDVDRKRAAEELGFTSKEDVLSLRQLEEGLFYGFGPAISRDVIKFKVGDVQTTHPEAGAAATPVSPPKHKVQSVLAQLADLPQEAEEERATVATLQQQVRELKRELAQKPTAPAAKVEVKEKPVLKDLQLTRVERWIERCEKFFEKVQRAAVPLQLEGLKVVAPVREAIAKVETRGPAAGVIPFKPQHAIERTVAAPIRRQQTVPHQPASGATGAAGGDKAATPTGKLRQIMVALAQNPDGLNARQVGARAAVSTKGGSFTTFMSNGRVAGWVEGDKHMFRITALGLQALGPFDPLPTGRALFDHWMAKLGHSTKPALIFKAIYDAYPNSLTKEEISERASVSTAGGSFTTFMSTLRVRDLIVDVARGEFKANPELFE